LARSHLHLAEARSALTRPERRRPEVYVDLEHLVDIGSRRDQLECVDAIRQVRVTRPVDVPEVATADGLLDPVVRLRHQRAAERLGEQVPRPLRRARPHGRIRFLEHLVEGPTVLWHAPHEHRQRDGGLDIARRALSGSGVS
jgi:hypothetical protein